MHTMLRTTTRSVVAGGALTAMLVLLLPAGCRRAPGPQSDPSATASPVTVAPAAAVHEGLLYGRVTRDDGVVYEGRLRWGGDEEALWGNSFNGFKDENPWAAHVPADRLRTEGLSIFGITVWQRRIDLGRPFMARYGDIARIESRGADVRVVLKSGTAFDLDRFAADDLADGVRVWDARQGVVDLDEGQILSIDLLPAPRAGVAPEPLHGTVRTRHGDFTGLVAWDREACLSTDEIDGRTADGEVSLRFDSIRAIARRSPDSSLVTLRDGREVVLSGTREAGVGHRGIYVDDPRYGRVLISWNAFERVDFSPGGTGPAYDDFRPGRPLTGRVITRSGRRLAGRLVYDLDESETTETLDGPSQGIDYTIPFGLIASIVLPGLDESNTGHARVTLHSGEVLQLERAGDLGAGNAGLLVFVDDRERPEYVPWNEVERIEFER